MPLAFESISHGTIAFGFFNIETDMLLLEHYFLFASDFCSYVSELAEAGKMAGHVAEWKVYSIADRAEIGDLMGAIHGVRFQGFIGEIYRSFPFPERPEQFKQEPDGFKRRVAVERTIQKYAQAVGLPVVPDLDRLEIQVGEYRFDQASLHDLIEYVWKGGYPRWKDGVRPPYVVAMREKLEKLGTGLFKGIVFDE
jgi:hypothetical protein